MIRNLVFTSADNYENEKHDHAYDKGHPKRFRYNKKVQKLY